MKLHNKVAVVTGGAAGLGRAVAERFAREGAAVVVADRSADDGNVLAERLKAEGLKAVFIQTDISEESQVQALFGHTMERFQKVDILYSNAAVLSAQLDARAHELTIEIWDYIMNINLRGPFLCAKYAIPGMLRNGGGSIIQLSSPTGLYGCAPNLTAYSTSKAGVTGLTRVMAAAYARDNIRVNAIVPGTMVTPMNDYVLSDERSREEYRAAVPLGRLGTPADVEGLAVFLASDESSYCTGGFYMCDGGLTAV